MVGDSRWVHRPVFDWHQAESRNDLSSIPGRIYHAMLRIAQIRQQNLAFTRADTEIVDSGNAHVFAYFRQHAEQSVLVLANFSEREQVLAANRLRLLGLRKTVTDLMAGRTIIATQSLAVEPYQFMVLLSGR